MYFQGPPKLYTYSFMTSKDFYSWRFIVAFYMTIYGVFYSKLARLRDEIKKAGRC